MSSRYLTSFNLETIKTVMLHVVDVDICDSNRSFISKLWVVLMSDKIRSDDSYPGSWPALST